MKKSFYPLILLIILLFTGCELFDKPDDGMDNYLKVNGTENELNAGLFENFGKIAGTESYNIHLSIYSSGLTITSHNGKIDSITGTGNVLYFELVTSSGTIIDDGEYAMDGSKNIKTYSKPQYIIGWNAPQTGLNKNITSGVLTIIRTGNIYEIDFEGVDEFGLSIEGYYKGPLSYFIH